MSRKDISKILGDSCSLHTSLSLTYIYLSRWWYLSKLRSLSLSPSLSLVFLIEFSISLSLCIFLYVFVFVSSLFLWLYISQFIYFFFRFLNIKNIYILTWFILFPFQVTEEDLVSRASPDLRVPRSPCDFPTATADLRPDSRPAAAATELPRRSPADPGLARIAASMNQHLTDLVAVLQVGTKLLFY